MAQYDQHATVEQQTQAVDSISGSTNDALKALFADLEGKEGEITLLQNTDPNTPYKLESDVTSDGIIAQNVQFTGTSVSSSTAYVGNSTGIFNSTSPTPVTQQFDNNNGLTYNNLNDQNNSIDFTGTNTAMSVTTGDGNDEMTVHGTFTGSITTGSGELTLSLNTSAQENSEISVDAGQGFDLLKLFGAAIKHAFSYINGKFHMNSAGVDMENVEAVVTDVNDDGTLDAQGGDHVTMLATNAQDSLAAKLYVAALGREIFDSGDQIKDTSGDQLGGIKFWMAFNSAEDIDLVRSFYNCDETQGALAGLSNEEFVDKIMANIGKFDGSLNGSLADQIVSELDSGTIDKADALLEIVNAWQADANHQIVGGDGQVYVVEAFNPDDNASA